MTIFNRLTQQLTMLIQGLGMDGASEMTISRCAVGSDKDTGWHLVMHYADRLSVSIFLGTNYQIASKALTEAFDA